MAGCGSCGYWIPDDAKKCAHCGEWRVKQKPDKWKWLALGTNLTAVFASLATCVMAGVMVFQTRSMENQAISLEAQTQVLKNQAASIEAQTKILQKNFELEYIPLVKIGAISLNIVPYTEVSGDKSVAVYFSIPIENRHGFAYDVKIAEKVIDLGNKKAGLEDTSLQSSLTMNSFELSPGQIRYDKIGIDIPDIEKCFSGEKSFTLRYKIEYSGLAEATKDIFIYNYEVMFTNGQFQIVREERIAKK